jgi:hypothetical protein
MNRHSTHSALGHGGLDRGRTDAEVIGLDVDEDRCRAGQSHRVCRCGECERWHGGSGVSFTNETVKGVEYAIFAATAGAYSASYASSSAAPMITSTTATAEADGTATVQWETNEPATSEVVLGTSPSAQTTRAVEAGSAGDHAVEIEDLVPGRTYYYPRCPHRLQRFVIDMAGTIAAGGLLRGSRRRTSMRRQSAMSLSRRCPTAPRA